MPNILLIIAWASVLLPNLAMCWFLYRASKLNRDSKPLVIEREVKPKGTLIRTAKGVYLHQERFDPVVNTDEDQYIDEMNRKGRNE